jgi:hypothetical protein
MTMVWSYKRNEESRVTQQGVRRKEIYGTTQNKMVLPASGDMMNRQRSQKEIKKETWEERRGRRLSVCL